MMPTARAVVFSKDRPLQLDATLRSLAAHMSDVASVDVQVLYKARTPRYALGYRRIEAEHPGVTLRRERDFRRDVLDLLTGPDYVLFLVDDTLFVNRCAISDGIAALEDPACIGFSYRLGRNTTYCQELGQDRPVPEFREVDPGIRVFDWTSAEFDFGYPVEVSSSLYRARDMLALSRSVRFKGPNVYEGKIVRQARKSLGSRRLLACYETSVAFSIPVNLVQEGAPAWLVVPEDVRPSSLLSRYVSGERLDVASYHGFVSAACHQTIPLVFERVANPAAVSIVITDVSEQTLRESLGSIASMDYSDFELVVVGDEASGGIASNLESLRRSRPNVRIADVVQANGAGGVALNAGIRAASGRYILPLRSGDRVEPGALQPSVSILDEHPELDVVADTASRASVAGRPSEALSRPDTEDALGRDCPASAIFRTEVWDAVGGYDDVLRGGYEHLDFWLRISEKGLVTAPAATAIIDGAPHAMDRTPGWIDRDPRLMARLRSNHSKLQTPVERGRRLVRALLPW